MNKFKALTEVDLDNPNCIEYEQYNIYECLHYWQPEMYYWNDGICKYVTRMSEEDITTELGVAIEHLENEKKLLIAIYKKRLCGFCDE